MTTTTPDVDVVLDVDLSLEPACSYRVDAFEPTCSAASPYCEDPAVWVLRWTHAAGGSHCLTRLACDRHLAAVQAVLAAGYGIECQHKRLIALSTPVPL